MSLGGCAKNNYHLFSLLSSVGLKDTILKFKAFSQHVSTSFSSNLDKNLQKEFFKWTQVISSSSFSSTQKIMGGENKESLEDVGTWILHFATVVERPFQLNLEIFYYLQKALEEAKKGMTFFRSNFSTQRKNCCWYYDSFKVLKLARIRRRFSSKCLEDMKRRDS